MKQIADLSDEQLVDFVRSKDKELYAEIIKRYQAKLMRYASYLTNDDSVATDVVQEALIKAYVNLNGFDIKKKFSSWIYRIVHNEAMNSLAKRRNQRPIDDQFDIDSGINLEDQLIKEELRTHAHTCLSEMPILYKEPISLYFLEEKSYEEISDILRIPIGTVGTRINRAKGIMKKLCQKHLK